MDKVTTVGTYAGHDAERVYINVDGTLTVWFYVPQPAALCAGHMVGEPCKIISYMGSNTPNFN